MDCLPLVLVVQLLFSPSNSVFVLPISNFKSELCGKQNQNLINFKLFHSQHFTLIPLANHFIVESSQADQA